MAINPTNLTTTTSSLLLQTAAAVAGSPLATSTLKASIAAAKGEIVIAIADVLSRNPDGTATVQIEGSNQIVNANETFQVGGRYVVAIKPNGVDGKPEINIVTDHPNLDVAVSKAVLRSTESQNQLTDLLPQLRTELDQLLKSTGTNRSSIQKAAENVKSALDAVYPKTDHAPTAKEIQTFVRDSGIQLEAKLAKATETDSSRPLDSQTALKDVKATLLGLLHAVGKGSPIDQSGLNNPGTVVTREAVSGIEAQQAINTLADTVGGPYVIPVPFPNGDSWQTAWAAIEPDPSETASGTSSTNSFRVLINVNLTDLGETWIDAGVGKSNVKAIVYVSNEKGRIETQNHIDELKSSLASDGFENVLVEVRSTDQMPVAAKRRTAAMQAVVPETAGLLDVNV